MGQEPKESYDVPEGYYYTKDHEWLKKKGEEAGTVIFLVGITDYAAKMLHDIVYVSLSSEGTSLKQKDVFGQVESVKTVSDVYMPISGTVLKSNQKLTQVPELVSSSPYVDGWMLEVKPSNYESEIKQLLDARAYRAYISELKEGSS